MCGWCQDRQTQCHRGQENELGKEGGEKGGRRGREDRREGGGRKEGE